MKYTYVTTSKSRERSADRSTQESVLRMLLKIFTGLAVIFATAVIGYIALDQISQHYRMLGAQDFARLKTAEPAKKEPLSAAVCLKLAVSVTGARYALSAKNICSERIPTTETLVKFYNSKGVRIGVAAGLFGVPTISSMEPGEEMVHEWDIPSDVREQATRATSATVEVVIK